MAKLYTQAINGTNYEIFKSSPVFESKTRTGLNKFWQGHVLVEGKKYFLSSSHWQDTKTGKTSLVQWSEPYLVEPKNVGKKNETTVEEQALFELESILNKQQDKGYAPKGVKVTKLPLPMLAQKFTERAKHVQWPAYIQPKLDGMRMLYDGTKAWSRGNKEIIAKCIEHLKFDTRGYIVDGELILAGEHSQQMTMRAAKKYRPDVSPRLEYHVYDLVIPNATFKFRYETLQSLVKNAPVNVKLVPTHVVKDETEVMERHSEFTKAKYEGSIIRNMGGNYTPGQRSNDLLKLKDFQDAEFKIVDVVDGGGLAKGLAIFICVTEDAKEFRCVPEGTHETRAEWFKNKKKLIGKWLTIRFQHYSDEGIPVILNGVAIREDGDF